MLNEYRTSGKGPQCTSLTDGVFFFSTGQSPDTPSTASWVMDAQIMFTSTGLNADIWKGVFGVTDIKGMFGDEATVFAPGRCNSMVIPNNVQPKSEGSVKLSSGDPAAPPAIDFNYYSHPDDLATQVKILQRTVAIFNAPSWKAYGASILVPPQLAAKHGTDLTNEALLRDMATHLGRTVHHPTGTCRIGNVVDPQLRVYGVRGLRVADASVMPNITSGNTNAPCIMIGERCADFIKNACAVPV